MEKAIGKARIWDSVSFLFLLFIIAYNALMGTFNMMFLEASVRLMLIYVVGKYIKELDLALTEASYPSSVTILVPQSQELFFDI